MAGQLDFLVSLLLGALPALLLLWISLRRYSYPFVEGSLFDDRRVFFALAVGMVFGVFASVFTLLLGLDLLLLALILVFEEGFKLIYLNRRGYRGRFDTTFYGVPLGAGAASTAVVASAYWGSGGTLYAPETLLLLTLFSISLNLAHVDTGALVGFGASRGEMIVPLARAVGLRYAHTLILIPFLLAPGRSFAEGGPWALVSLVASIGFAGTAFLYVYRRVLPGTLPEDVRRKMRRERRRTLAAKE